MIDQANVIITGANKQHRPQRKLTGSDGHFSVRTEKHFEEDCFHPKH